jgi:competence protein ComEA
MKGKDYFSFTRRERIGILTLIIILLAVMLIPLFLPEIKPVPETVSIEQFVKPVKETAFKKKYVPHDSVYRYRERSYRKEYYRSYKKNSAYKDFKKYPRAYEKNKHHSFSRAIIDINTADTAAFIALPGIGSKLAARIVLFREKLGGFYNVEQVKEVYGLQDSVFKKIMPALKCDASIVKKLDINMAAKEDLKQHPYIRWNLANAVVSYRNQHGNFSSLDDLQKIENIEPSALKKMMPYLSL